MKQLLILPIAATILASSASAATLIPGSGITVTASTVNGNFGPLTVVVDGTGLTAGVHGTANNSMWFTGNALASSGWISFDLGSTVVLDSIHVWNSSTLTQLGTNQLDIYVSTVATPGAINGSDWTQIGTDVNFLQAPASNNTGFDLETQVGNILPGTAVRHVRFEVDSNFDPGQNNYAGLSEVQFFEADAVPEPSGALLGGLGALLLLRRRRH